MANVCHGSPERMPGALVRAVGVLFLQKKELSREALARELKEHLGAFGVVGTHKEHALTKVAQDLGVASKDVRQIEVEALAALRQLHLLQGLSDVCDSDETAGCVRWKSGSGVRVVSRSDGCIS